MLFRTMSNYYKLYSNFCDSQSPTVASLVATDNGGIRWYDTASSTTPLSSSTSLISGEDYFADDNTGTWY